MSRQLFTAFGTPKSAIIITFRRLAHVFCKLVGNTKDSTRAVCFQLIVIDEAENAAAISSVGGCLKQRVRHLPPKHIVLECSVGEQCTS